MFFFLFVFFFYFYQLLLFMYSPVICSSINRYMRLSCIALFMSGNLNNNEPPYASRSLSQYIFISPRFIPHQFTRPSLCHHLWAG